MHVYVQLICFLSAAVPSPLPHVQLQAAEEHCLVVLVSGKRTGPLKSWLKRLGRVRFVAFQCALFFTFLCFLHLLLKICPGAHRKEVHLWAHVDAGLEGTFGNAHSKDLMLCTPSGDWLLRKKLESGPGEGVLTLQLSIPGGRLQSLQCWGRPLCSV